MDLRLYEQAIDDYDRAIDLDFTVSIPDDLKGRVLAVVYYNRGLANDEWGRSEEALADYSEALDLYPADTDALICRAWLLSRLGRSAEALADLDRGVAIAPEDAEMHANRANALLRLGHPEEGLAACDRALALDPKESVALYNKACAFARGGDAESAARLLAEAIRRDPQNAEDARNDSDFDGIRNRTEIVVLLS